MRHARHTRRLGLTMVELILAMAILASVGGIVTGLLYAAAQASESGDGGQEMQAGEMAGIRLQSAIRGASCVLAKGAHSLVLWTGDRESDGRPNLSELRRLEWNPSTGEVLRYEAPEGLSSQDDSEYDPIEDFDKVTRDLAGGATFPGYAYMTGITRWSITLDAADVTGARLVRYDMKGTVGGRAAEWAGVIALRGAR